MAQTPEYTLTTTGLRLTRSTRASGGAEDGVEIGPAALLPCLTQTRLSPGHVLDLQVRDLSFGFVLNDTAGVRVGDAIAVRVPPTRAPWGTT